MLVERDLYMEKGITDKDRFIAMSLGMDVCRYHNERILGIQKEYTEDEFKSALDRIFNGFNETEKSIFRYRFGLEDGCPHTLQETGDRFGITSSKVRNTESNGIRRLRREARNIFSNDIISNSTTKKKEYVRPTFDIDDYLFLEEITGEKYDYRHKFTREELTDILKQIKAWYKNAKPNYKVINKHKVDTNELKMDRYSFLIESSIEELRTNIDQHFQIIECLIYGVDGVNTVREFNDMNQIDEYAEYIERIIIQLDPENRDKYINHTKLIKDTIEIANELPIEKIRENDVDFYKKAVSTGLYELGLSTKTRNYLHNVSIDKYGEFKQEIEYCDLIVSLGDFLILKAPNNVFLKKTEKATSEMYEDLIETLKRNNLRILNNSVEEVKQQLIYLFSLNYGAKKTRIVFNAFSTIIAEMFNDRLSIKEMYDFFDHYFEENEAFSEDIIWTYEYINRKIDLSKNPSLESTSTITLNVCEYKFDDFCFLTKEEEIESCEIIVKFLIDIDLQDGVVVSISPSYTKTLLSDAQYEANEIDFFELWNNETTDKAKKVLEGILI